MLEKLINYNNWATQQLFNSLKQDEAAVPAAVMRLLSHIVVTQSIWLSRIENKPATVAVWEKCDLNTCISLHRQSTEILQQLSMPEENLQQIIAYTNTQGLYFKNSVHDIIIHVLNHGTYHRAQIAAEMRKNGFIPVNTDYITYVR